MKSVDNRPDCEMGVSAVGARKDFRAPLSSTASIAFGKSVEASASWLRAEVLDLSLGGVRVSFELDDGRRKDLPGTACSVKFSLKGEDRMFPGLFAWVSSGSLEPEGICEAGIRFEDLSVDDKSDLVSLFMWTTLDNSLQEEKS